MENPINITMLNDFIFCPLSIYYHNLYDDMETSLYQIFRLMERRHIKLLTIINTQPLHIFCRERVFIVRNGYAKNEDSDYFVIG